MSLPSTSETPVQATTATDAVPCPRCRQPLIDPKGLGWCKACGYCRSLQESEPKAVVASKPVASNQVMATGAAVGHTPKWFWVMVLGIALIAGATFAGNRFLILSALERALLTTMQIGIGLVIMFIGQFVGLLRIAPEEASLTFKDAVFPFRLYGMIFKRLPKTALTVYGGSWGLAAILSALIFIGGLGHWFTYLPKSQKNQIPQAQKTRSDR